MGGPERCPQLYLITSTTQQRPLVYGEYGVQRCTFPFEVLVSQVAISILAMRQRRQNAADCRVSEIKRYGERAGHCGVSTVVSCDGLASFLPGFGDRAVGCVCWGGGMMGGGGGGGGRNKAALVSMAVRFLGLPPLARVAQVAIMGLMSEKSAFM